MTTKKPKTPPSIDQIEDSIRLRQLFEQRAGMSQLEFGQVFGIGNQGMVWQYLNADKPKGSVLNVGAAICFAEGLRCRVSDFSPTLQREIDRIAAYASPVVARKEPGADTAARGLASASRSDVITAPADVEEEGRKSNFKQGSSPRTRRLVERYMSVDMAKQAIVDFFIKDESEAAPAWVDADAKAYSDSLQLKALRWLTKHESRARAKTAT